MTDVDPLPTTLRWAVRLLWLESAAVAVLAAALVVQTVTAEAASLVDALAFVVFVLLLAAATGGLAVALSHRRPRARAPALALQLVGGVAASYYLAAGLIWLLPAVVAVCLAVITLLLTPSASSALAAPPVAGR